jgi:hypothetical protein
VVFLSGNPMVSAMECFCFQCIFLSSFFLSTLKQERNHDPLWGWWQLKHYADIHGRIIDSNGGMEPTIGDRNLSASNAVLAPPSSKPFGEPSHQFVHSADKVDPGRATWSLVVRPCNQWELGYVQWSDTKPDRTGGPITVPRSCILWEACHSLQANPAHPAKKSNSWLHTFTDCSNFCWAKYRVWLSAVLRRQTLSIGNLQSTSTLIVLSIQAASWYKTHIAEPPKNWHWLHQRSRQMFIPIVQWSNPNVWKSQWLA